jgi:hypothetical protein
MDFACTCSNRDLCNMRMARGLKAFCDRTLKSSGRDKAGTYGTYAEAAANANGRRVKAAHTPGQGMAKRFAVVG